MCVNDINSTVLSIITTLVLIFYSIFGSIKAVTTTDVFQCITFVLILPCLAWVMFHKVNKPFADIITILGSYEKFQFSQLFQWNRRSIKILFIGLTFAVGYIRPSLFQRIYMASNVIQARKTFLFSSIFNFCITSVILLIGIFVFVDDPNLSITAIWPIITMNFAPVFKGFLTISLLAMAMSTADSNLNACSVMVIHDIVGSLRTNKISNAHQLRLARITSFIIGILAMLLSFYKKDLLALLLLGNDFFTPIVIAPLLLAIYGFRSSSRTALIGMAIGIIAILVWQKYFPDIDGSFPAMLTNGIAMLLAHYSLPRREGDGWGKPSLDYQQLQQAKQRRFYRFKQQFKGFFSCLQHMPIHNYHVVLLAFYILVTSWLPLLGKNILNINQNQDLLYWLLAQCVVALAMIIYVILSKKAPVPFNRYIVIFGY